MVNWHAKDVTQNTNNKDLIDLKQRSHFQLSRKLSNCLAKTGEINGRNVVETILTFIFVFICPKFDGAGEIAGQVPVIQKVVRLSVSADD